MGSNVFLDTIINKRTDAEFRVMEYKNHHNHETIPLNYL